MAKKPQNSPNRSKINSAVAAMRYGTESHGHFLDHDTDRKSEDDEGMKKPTPKRAPVRNRKACWEHRSRRERQAHPGNQSQRDEVLPTFSICDLSIGARNLQAVPRTVHIFMREKNGQIGAIEEL